MKPIKSVVGLIAALVPIAYCGGLVYYFVGVPGRLQSSVGLPSGATDGVATQLGPTVIGLGAFGVLFAFIFILRLMRSATTQPPAKRMAKVEIDEGEPFDADAALARYMAKKAAGEIAEPAPPPSTPVAGFGRKLT
jgi:hypothetical protein